MTLHLRIIFLSISCNLLTVAVLCEETACSVMKMYIKYCCQKTDICYTFHVSACISFFFWQILFIYVQVSLRLPLDTHEGSCLFTHYSVFMALQKYEYLMQTLIYWKAIYVRDPINCFCKFNNMLHLAAIFLCVCQQVTSQKFYQPWLFDNSCIFHPL